MFALKDSRGRESTTLAFVSATWLAIWIKYLFAGATLPLFGSVPPMSATEFSLATAGVLAIWLGREWTDKKINGSAP